MRSWAVLMATLVATVVVAGCSGGGGEEEATASDFEDLGLEATPTTGVLLGGVVDQAIRPLADVDITVTKPDGGELKDKTDEAGRFAFEGLPPGGYIVHARHPSYTAQQASTVVEAGVAEPPVVRILMER